MNSGFVFVTELGNNRYEVTASGENKGIIYAPNSNVALDRYLDKSGTANERNTMTRIRAGQNKIIPAENMKQATEEQRAKALANHRIGRSDKRVQKVAM